MLKTKEKIYQFVVNDLVKHTHIIQKKGGGINEQSLSFDFYKKNDLLYSCALLGNYYTSATSFMDFHNFFREYLQDSFGIQEEEIIEIWRRYKNELLPSLHKGLVNKK